MKKILFLLAIWPAISYAAGGGGINLTGNSGYIIIQEEGSSLTQRKKVNFIGASITCADNSGTGVTDCTLTGTGGGGGGGGSSLYVEPSQVSVSTLFLPASEFGFLSGGGASTMTVKNATGTFSATLVFNSSDIFKNFVSFSSNVFVDGGSLTVRGAIVSTNGITVGGVLYMTQMSTVDARINGIGIVFATDTSKSAPSFQNPSTGTLSMNSFGIANSTGLELGKFLQLTDFMSSVTAKIDTLSISTTVIFNSDSPDISERTYFLTNVSSGGPNSYQTIMSSPSTAAEFVRTRSVSSAAGLVMISSHITLTGDPGVRKIPSGAWGFLTYLNLDSIAGLSQLIVTVSTIGIDGTLEWEILSTTSADQDELTVTSLDQTVIQQGEIAMSTSDRILVKYWGRTNSITPVNFNLYMAGTSRASHLNSPIGAVYKFVQLTDTPSTLIGSARKYLSVNNDQTATVFVSTITDDFNAHNSTADTVDRGIQSAITAGILPVYDEGSLITGQATTLNFAGSGVTATNSGSTVTVTVSGGGSGGSDNLGSHVATAPVQMANFAIQGSSQVYVGTTTGPGLLTISSFNAVPNTDWMSFSTGGPQPIFDIQTASTVVRISTFIITSENGQASLTVGTTIYTDFGGTGGAQKFSYFSRIGDYIKGPLSANLLSGSNVKFMYTHNNATTRMVLKNTSGESEWKENSSGAAFGSVDNQGVALLANDNTVFSVDTNGNLDAPTAGARFRIGSGDANLVGSRYEFVNGSMTVSGNGSGLMIGTTNMAVHSGGGVGIGTNVFTGATLTLDGANANNRSSLIITSGAVRLVDIDGSSATIRISTLCFGAICGQWSSTQTPASMAGGDYVLHMNNLNQGATFYLGGSPGAGTPGIGGGLAFTFDGTIATVFSTVAVQTPFGLATVLNSNNSSTMTVFGATNPYTSISLPASAWVGVTPASASAENAGFAMTSTATAYNNFGETYHLFACPNTTFSFVTTSFRMPFEWDGSSIAFQVVWHSTGGQQTTMGWSLGGVVTSSGSSIYQAATSSATVFSTFTGSNTEIMSNQSAAYNLVGTPAPGSRVKLFLCAQGGTFSGRPRMTEVLIWYRKSVWDGRLR